jgi:hypothetical protein
VVRLDVAGLVGDVEGVKLGRETGVGLLAAVGPDERVDLDRVDLVELLDGVLDLALVRLDVDDEDEGVVLLNLLLDRRGREEARSAGARAQSARAGLRSGHAPSWPTRWRAGRRSCGTRPCGERAGSTSGGTLACAQDGGSWAGGRRRRYASSCVRASWCP